MSGTSFSSDGVEVITRQVQASSNPARKERSERDLTSYYDIDRCVNFVTEGRHHRVCTIPIMRLEILFIDGCMEKGVYLNVYFVSN